ncbi:MAG: hypothetical protein AB1405_15525, partial [Bdellovibrionota bacterium]
MAASPLHAFAKAFSRSLKAVGYYDMNHPILLQIQKEAHEALLQACKVEPFVTFAGVGSRLLTGEKDPPLSDASAKAVAEHFFARSVVAMRFHRTVRREDVAAFLQCMGEGPDKIRAAGGLRPLLEQRRAQGIEVFEVDFAALFAGDQSALKNMTGQDALVETALKEVLRLKENKDKTGTALGISLTQIATPESLGSFLDDILAKAEPGVVVAIPGSPGVAGGRAGVPGLVGGAG